MENTIYVGISRLNALQRQMDVVANNIANANTPSFKGERLMFTDYLAKTGFSKESVSFVNDMGTLRDFSAGQHVQSGSEFDVALDGEGYFLVDTPAGERYTKLGRFRLGEDNFMTTAQGYQVLDERRKPIRLPENFNEMKILPNGKVVVDDRNIGRLGVSYFDNEQVLRKTADGYYQYKGPQPSARVDDEKTKFNQGFYEGSNVNAIQEMTNMIAVQRAFEMATNMIEKEDDRLKRMMRVMGPSQ